MISIKIRKRYQILFGIGVLFLAVKLVHAWWNPGELVTLHGKDIPVAEALRSFSKQTGRKILFPESLSQKVTLQLERVPLEEAIEAATDQADLSHTRLFLLTGNSTLHENLIKKISEQKERPVTMQLARTARWGDGERAPGHVTYQAAAKNAEAAVAEINFATDSYFYYSGEPTEVSVEWKNVPIREAAAQLASITKTDHERIYQVFERNRNAENRRPSRSDASPEEMERWGQRLFEQIGSLPPAEKAVAEEQLHRQEERMQEWAAMTEEQRTERRMQRFTQGNQEERLIRRLKNSTPESRAKRYQRREARNAARGTPTPPPAAQKPPSDNP